MSSRNNNNNKKPNKKRNQSGSPQDDPRWSPKHTSCSKSASYLLRHGAKKEGLPISDDGFVQVDELMKMKTMKPFSRQLLYETVEWNGKQRFFIKKENDIEYIRANQGHTLAVPKLELVPITDASNYPVVLHGTYLAVWPKIKVEGLKRMNRNHIHFASGKFGEVKSGVRSNVEIIIYIDLAAAIKDGFKFFLSDNGVILGEGGANGALPPKYITHAISTTNNQPFDPDFPKSDFPKFVAKNNNNNNNNNANNVNTNNNNKNETQELEWPGRSSEEVFNRLKWDSKYDSTECIIGYEDRFTGIQEISLTAWEHRDVTADAFIPWHRVYYFKYKDEVIWDREKKTDLVFGGEKKELPSKNKKEKKNNNDSDDTDTESEPLEYIVVLDFEATCDESKSFKPQEIIEFPSVLYNVKEQKVEAEFQKYVKPTARPKLTKFCTSLTGITQTQVDNGILITEALKEYRLWLIEHKLIDEKDNDLKRWSLCTCGDWDLNTMLPSQAKLLNLNTPRYFKRFVNMYLSIKRLTRTIC